MRERKPSRGCKSVRQNKAGCVPVRRKSDGSWEVLLLESRWTQGLWGFPKGGVEADETESQTAVRETVEEGGVTGTLGHKLGEWRFDRRGQHQQAMWILYVHIEYSSDDIKWKERKKRTRAWLSFDDARNRLLSISEDLRRPELVEMLQAAESKLTSPRKG